MKLRVLDLFSGLGGFSLGLEATGHFETIAFCDNEPFPQKLLAERWPGVPVHGDVTTMEFFEGMADVICGGFPCQDVSLAGKRAGIAGERSGLYRELVRAVRVVRPQYFILENVAALLADGMGDVLGDFSACGYSVEWDCVPAQNCGAPHERDRVWIVGTRIADAVDAIGRPDGASCGRMAWEVSVCERSESSDRSANDTAQCQRESPGNASDANGIDGRSGTGRQDGPQAGDGSQSNNDADAASLGCGTRRTRRPPDSFARIRERSRWNATDPYGSRLAFGQGVGGNPRPEFTPAQRNVERDGRQSIWPDESALSGVDDDVPNRVERVKALGNSIIPEIPRLIGQAIIEAQGLAR